MQAECQKPLNALKKKNNVPYIYKMQSGITNVLWSSKANGYNSTLQFGMLYKLSFSVKIVQQYHEIKTAYFRKSSFSWQLKGAQLEVCTTDNSDSVSVSSLCVSDNEEIYMYVLGG